MSDKQTVDVAVVRRLVKAIQDGGGDQTRRMAEARMVELGGSVENGPAGLHYVRVVAFYTAGDFTAALAASDAMLVAAEREGHPGWRSKALATRADCRIVLGDNDVSAYDFEAVLRDLIGAEVALAAGGMDRYLRGGVHLGIGISYFRLRLYELAEPHYTAACEIASRDDPDDTRLSVALAHLAELHLHWALELYRIGDPAAANEHNRIAGAHAVRGRRHAPLDSFWRELNGLLDGCARADGEDPAQAAEDIRGAGKVALDLGHLDWWLFAMPFLAFALARSGRLEEGREIAAAAVAQLPAQVDWLIAAAVTHAHAVLLGKDGAVEYQAALRYGDSLAAALWRERQRTLQTARTLRSIEQLRIDHERASRSAETDPLTGIPNRRAFDREMARHATTHPTMSTAVMVIDMDKLKLLNDGRGHPAGDRALHAVAAALAGQVRDGDHVARTGGDEFYALLQGAGLDEAVGVAERMLQAVRNLTVSVTVSIGVASGPSHAITDTLLRADQAMYAAKQAGGDRCWSAAEAAEAGPVRRPNA